MVVEQGPHHAGPWLRKHEVTLTFSLDLVTTFVQQGWFHAKEWEALSIEINIKLNISLVDRSKLTADPGFIGVAPGNGVITCPPVSVCQKVSTIEHFSLPTTL